MCTLHTSLGLGARTPSRPDLRYVRGSGTSRGHHRLKQSHALTPCPGPRSGPSHEGRRGDAPRWSLSPAPSRFHALPTKKGVPRAALLLIEIKVERIYSDGENLPNETPKTAQPGAEIKTSARAQQTARGPSPGPPVSINVLQPSRWRGRQSRSVTLPAALLHGVGQQRAAAWFAVLVFFSFRSDSASVKCIPCV